MSNGVANLLAAYQPSYDVEAGVEARDLLELVHAKASLSEANAPGILGITAREEPRSIIGRLRYLNGLQPERFVYISSWVPCDYWCPSSLEEILGLVKRVAQVITDEESWKIVLKRTQTPFPDIGKLIEDLPRCVSGPRSDLISPQRIIYVHMIGCETCVSLLGMDDILEVQAEPSSLVRVGSREVFVE